jgi:hypothetical protein
MDVTRDHEASGDGLHKLPVPRGGSERVLDDRERAADVRDLALTERELAADEREAELTDQASIVSAAIDAADQRDLAASGRDRGARLRDDKAELRDLIAYDRIESGSDIDVGAGLDASAHDRVAADKDRLWAGYDRDEAASDRALLQEISREAPEG